MFCHNQSLLSSQGLVKADWFWWELLKLFFSHTNSFEEEWKERPLIQFVADIFWIASVKDT